MLKKFEEMPEAKKLKIINAALSEFASKGYDKGSTNIIAQKAGISKGLIFHYFNSKANLYLYLYDYTLKVISDDLYQNVDLQNGDILQRIMDITLKKVTLLQKYPDILAFSQKAYLEDSKQIKQALLNKQQLSNHQAQQDFLANIDYSYFKNDLDIDKAMMTIYATLEKVSVASITQKELDLDTTFTTIKTYTDFFRDIFYKKKGD